MFDWQHEDTSWTGAAEVAQMSAQAMDSYAFKTSSELTAARDYHIISAMRQVEAGTGTPSYGLVLRAQLSTQDKTRYSCSWIPKNRELRIEVKRVHIALHRAHRGTAGVADAGRIREVVRDRAVVRAAAARVGLVVDHRGLVEPSLVGLAITVVITRVARLGAGGTGGDRAGRAVLRHVADEVALPLADADADGARHVRGRRRCFVRSRDARARAAATATAGASGAAG